MGQPACGRMRSVQDTPVWRHFFQELEPHGGLSQGIHTPGVISCCLPQLLHLAPSAHGAHSCFTLSFGGSSCSTQLFVPRPAAFQIRFAPARTQWLVFRGSLGWASKNIFTCEIFCGTAPISPASATPCCGDSGAGHLPQANPGLSPPVGKGLSAPKPLLWKWCLLEV